MIRACDWVIVATTTAKRKKKLCIQGHIEKNNFYPNIQDIFSFCPVVCFKYPSEIGKNSCSRLLAFFCQQRN
jgi:hypothetical protein